MQTISETLKSVTPQNIPAELKAIPHWVLWKLEDRDGKATKTPYQAHGALAKVNDPTTWTTYDAALAAYQAGGFSGIGIVLTKDDAVIGVDLDKCLNPDTGELDAEASQIVAALPTYCEVSPSGRGLRLFGFGRLPQGGRRKGAVEMYESGRYLTVTGLRFNGHDALADITTEITAVHARIFAAKTRAASLPVDTKPPPGALNLDDASLIEKAAKAKNGAAFERLWRGDTAGYGNDHSAADQALCNQLAFWTNGDAARIDRLFRQSGLMRPKWDTVHYSDGRTYGQGTIEKTLASLREGYTGRPASAPTAQMPPSRTVESFGNWGQSTSLVCIAPESASAKAIYEATGEVTVNAGAIHHLYKVAQAVREQFPRLRILVCGDSDPSVKAKARTAAFSLVGGSYWCNPDFLTPTPEEIEIAALDLAPPLPDGTISPNALKQARENLKARDAQRVAEESPATFADLAGWFEGPERIKQQIAAAIALIGLIRLKPGKTLTTTVDRAEAEAIFSGVNFYQRLGTLVRPFKQDVKSGIKGVTIPLGALVLAPVDNQWLARKFATSARWEKMDRKYRAWVPADPPERSVKTYLSMAGEWRLDVLKGIVECPTLRHDGSLITQSGYDPVSGLLVDYRDAPVNVPETPTYEQALAALEFLKTPYAEFSFSEGNLDLSVVLAGLLTAVIRRSLRTAPLTAIDAPMMGSGKGLIVDSIALVATGRAASAVAQGNDEAEDEKRLGALLLRGVPLLNIDNIERPLSGDLLCSALTQETVCIRTLGKSEMSDMPTNLALFATGNNLSAKGDMVRRVLLCRLDPGCERPDARTFTLDLPTWMKANRARMLEAALTVLRAYVVAGRPKQDIPPYGSFEEWSNWIRSALVWLGMPDPCLTRARLEAEDSVSTALSAILPLWFDAFKSRPMTAAEVVTEVRKVDYAVLRGALMEVAGSRRESDAVDPFRLGHWLRKFKGRVSGGFKLEKAGDEGHAKVVFWKVILSQPANTDRTKPNQFAGNAGNAGNVSFSRAKNENHKKTVESIFTGGSQNNTRNYPHYPQNLTLSVESIFTGGSQNNTRNYPYYPYSQPPASLNDGISSHHSAASPSVDTSKRDKGEP